MTIHQEALGRPGVARHRGGARPMRLWRLPRGYRPGLAGPVVPPERRRCGPGAPGDVTRLGLAVQLVTVRAICFLGLWLYRQAWADDPGPSALFRGGASPDAKPAGAPAGGECAGPPGGKRPRGCDTPVHGPPGRARVS